MADAEVSHSLALQRVLFSQLAAIEGNKLSEEDVESLLLICGDSMLLAALDLVDSNDVSQIHVGTGRVLHRCAGTTTTYAVTLDPLFCPCPAFSQQVLYLRAHVICKHVLACLLASKLKRYVKREGSLDLLAQLVMSPADVVKYAV